MASPFYAAEHEAYREVVRRFVEKEIGLDPNFGFGWSARRRPDRG
jgi:hypothetical protein